MKKEKSLILIGKRIKKIRMEKGLSQEELAFRCETNRCYIGDIERGEHNPGAWFLIRIAESLGVEVGEFFPPLFKK